MFAAHIAVTVIAAVFTATAAVTYLIGHEYPKSQLDLKRIPRSLGPVFGLLLAAGALGLLAGFVLPWLGTLAAACLMLYFIGAIVAHLRVGSRNLGGGAVFLLISIAALVTSVGSHR
jgi:DoxX-like protein